MHAIDRPGRQGIRDWLIQRVTAIIIGLYAIFILSYFLTHPVVDFSGWTALFQHLVMKVATVLTVASILWHAWIGLWTVFTDYVKPAALRLFLEIIVILLLLSYLIWVFEILRTVGLS